MKKSSKLILIIMAVIFIALLILTQIFYVKGNPAWTYMGIAAGILLVSVVSITISNYLLSRQIKKSRLLENRLGLWNTISYRVKKSGEHAFNDLPIGIMILSDNNEIVWSNNYAKDLFMSQLNDMPLASICKPILDAITNEEKDFQVDIYGHKYQIEFNYEYRILYLSDITEIMKIKTKYNERITALGYINIDNLESVLSDFDVQERAEFMYRIVTEIAKWSESFGAYVRAYSDNSYLLIMDKKQLQLIQEDNFSILDTIKNLGQGKAYKISLSMGIACVDEDINSLSDLAREQLELSINRGGDQASVYIDGVTTFYGARTDTAQSETKVSLRMKSEELQELMNSSDCVMVVGHANADADAFGATIAIYRMAKVLGRPAYIIFDKESIDATVKRIYETMEKEYVALNDSLISPQLALSRMTPDTLLMVVDCQKASLLSEPKLVKKASKIGVIDHHRRGDDAIDKLDFYLSSTAASSSVELIVQLYEFMEKEITFDRLEATWLLLGIIVDTNNFIYRCSEKTFKVSSILAKYGADMTGVKKYLKENKSEKLSRNNLIGKLEIYQDKIGIAVGDNDEIYQRAFLAKISDEIISIEGLDVGITVGRINSNQVGVSARNLGTINAQVLMEKLGGGGHYNNAAAQVTSDNIQDVVKSLKKYIDEYIEKEESMKVILTKDVKGHGKKNDVVDEPLGFANHLIRTSQAIVASDENLKRLDEEKKQAELDEERRIQEAKALKELVENTPLSIGVKVGVGGKVFGSVSSKQIIDAFYEKTKKELDKHAIELKGNLTELGTHTIPVTLYKSVKATITVYVVEKE